MENMPATHSQWTGVALPKPVAERIDAALARDKTYRSRSEFAKAAVLRMLEAGEKGAA